MASCGHGVNLDGPCAACDNAADWDFPIASDADAAYVRDLRESRACGHRECADADGHIDTCLYDFVDEQLEPEREGP